MRILADLEVYVRRAYRAYTLLSIDYEEGDNLEDGDNPNVLTWRFNIGQSHSPPSTPRLTQSRRTASVSDLSYLVNRHQSQPVRTGAIASFPNLLPSSAGSSTLPRCCPPSTPKSTASAMARFSLPTC